MSFSWKRIFKILFYFILVCTLIAGCYFVVVSKKFKIAYASFILDNREHYTDCYGLPFFAQVEKSITEHGDIIDKLKVVGAESITAEKLVCKGWDGGIELIKGDIKIEYNSHDQRIKIEELIGDNFFGIPWRGENH